MTNAYKIAQLAYSHGEHAVLDIGQLDIMSGAITSLVGTNGAGKSTLLDILAFVRPSQAQSLEFFGERVNDGSLNVLRRQIAYVQQKPYLFNMSVEKNIELGWKLRGKEYDERKALADATIEQMKLEGLRTKSAHKLSGGEIQKVAIARSLTLDPKVLLLDEPFTHLDRVSKAELEALLCRLSTEQTKTIIFTTHDQVQAQALADYTYQLENGEVRASTSLNTFSGKVDLESAVFRTARMEIHILETIVEGDKIAIDPAHLVLSVDKLKSSMRNQFSGKVVSLREEAGEIHLGVEAQESWQVIISRDALKELGITVGDSLWLSFKSSAVRVF